MSTIGAGEERKQRFLEFLAALEGLGLTQQQIATRAGLYPRYLSDVKTGRRGLTELTARRLAAEFAISHEWLLLGTGSMQRPTLSSSKPAVIVLRLLEELYIGDPEIRPGMLLEVAGHAAAYAAKSERPYVLQIPFGTRSTPLKRGDLLLISQRPDPEARCAIVSQQQELHLAQRRNPTGETEKSDHWRSLRTGRPIVGGKVVAVAGALIWSPLI